MFLSLAAAAPVSGQTVELLATDPPDGSLLNVGEALYVRLGYVGEQPLRFSVRGVLDGKERSEGTRTNPSPPYPAGRGEALVWIEYTQPIGIDALRLRVYDARWALLSEISVPVEFGWRADARLPARPPAAWVNALSAAQQSATRIALTPEDQEHGGPWLWLLMFAGWSIPGYIILQALLYRRWRDGWRKAALLPLWATVPILTYTVFALLHGSNLWPVVMLFSLPFAFVYLMVLVAARRLYGGN